MSIFIFLLMLSSIAKACDETIMIQADMNDCTVISPFEIACNVPKNIDLTIPSEGESCIIVRSPINNAILGRVSIKLHMFLECQSEVSFHTKAMDIKTATSGQCYGTGSCIGRACSTVQTNATIRELGDVNGYDGYTYCMDGDSVGCAFNVPSCLFYRTYGVPIHNAPIPVFQCTSWEPRIFAEVQIMDARKSRSFTANLTTTRSLFLTSLLRLDVKRVFEIKTPLPDSSLLFARFGNAVAWLDGRGARRASSMVMCMPDCPSDENCGKCYLRDDLCECESNHLSVSCDCDDQSELLYYLKTNTLPMEINDAYTMLGSSGKPEMHLRAHANVTLDSLKLLSQIPLTTCNITKTLLVGCSNCLQGASLNVICEAPVDIIGHLRCGQQEFAVRCGKSIVQTLKYMTKTQYVNEECTIECPLSKEQFTLEATLPFVQPAYTGGRMNLHGKDEPTIGFWDGVKLFLHGLSCNITITSVIVGFIGFMIVGCCVSAIIDCIF